MVTWVFSAIFLADCLETEIASKQDVNPNKMIALVVIAVRKPEEKHAKKHGQNAEKQDGQNVMATGQAIVAMATAETMRTIVEIL